MKPNLFIAGALFVQCCGTSVSAETFLVKDGQARAEIVIGEKPARTVKLTLKQRAEANEGK